MRALPLLVVLALTLAPSLARAEHLRDLVEVSGARTNQLLGYGLVTGLGGTGDDLSVPFTSQSVLAMLRRLGVQVDPGQLRLRNVAAVVVTATLPAFARPGTRVDVTVSSVGNARSLSGGVLLQTVLRGADQRAYAIAQGPLVVGGFVAQGSTGSAVRAGYPTTARVAEGATVEREVPSTMVVDGSVRLDLRTPGFTVASRIVQAVNQRFGDGTASAPDAGAVLVRAPETDLVGFLAALEELEVVPLRRARVVLNERTGTIVAGGDVRLAPAAVVHGGLTVVVRETPAVSQPAALGAGTTVVVPGTEVTAEEPTRSATLLPAAPTLADVARTLNRLGLSPRELGSVLEALRAAGALEAELVIQ
ncbi:MAG: flagellar basal body P-ring protein FlgI [Deltaproteobacteria bacterium]|nr:flagellar basal body P-ring protein FlgI [Deltaproteobacteria bacterium]